MSSEGATQDSGTTVAPETGAVASPNASGEATVAADASTAQAAPPVKDPVMEKLASMDPTALPEDFRRKLEYPFLADYTRKTQALAEEKARLADEKARIAEAMATRFANLNPAAPDEKTQLVERIKSGDLEAVVPLLNMTANEAVKPYATEQAMRSAVERAEAMHPYVRERAPQIAQALQENPELKFMAQADNFRYAPFVMAGIALNMEKAELQAKLSSVEKSIAEREAKAVEAYKAKVTGIPATTTRSGSTPSAVPGQKSAENVREAALAAWKELGYNPDDFK